MNIKPVFIDAQKTTDPVTGIDFTKGHVEFRDGSNQIVAIAHSREAAEAICKGMGYTFDDVIAAYTPQKPRANPLAPMLAAPDAPANLGALAVS